IAFGERLGVPGGELLQQVEPAPPRQLGGGRLRLRAVAGGERTRPGPGRRQEKLATVHATVLSCLPFLVSVSLRRFAAAWSGATNPTRQRGPTSLTRRVGGTA